MKIEFTNTGWEETTVKKFNVISFHKHFLNLSVKEWIKTNKKLKLKKGMRSHCACCHTSWTLLNGMTNSVMTDKGNQCVCDECFDKLGENKCH